jgi:hypothetical protein
MHMTPKPKSPSDNEFWCRQPDATTLNLVYTSSLPLALQEMGEILPSQWKYIGCASLENDALTSANQVPN